MIKLMVIFTIFIAIETLVIDEDLLREEEQNIRLWVLFLWGK